MNTIYFTDNLFWKREQSFLESTETEFLGRLENKLTTFEVLKHDDFEYKLYFDIDCDTITKEDFNEYLSFQYLTLVNDLPVNLDTWFSEYPSFK